MRAAWNDAVHRLLQEEGDALTEVVSVSGTRPSYQVFLTLPFLDAVQSSVDGDFELFVSNDRQVGAPPWVAAIHARKRGPYRVAGPPPYTPYTSLATGSRADLDKVLSAIAARFAEIRVQAPPGLAGHSDAPQGWQVRNFATYLAPVAPGPELYPLWSENRRRTLRTGKGDFQTVEHPDETAVLGRLVAQSYAGHGRAAQLGAAGIASLALAAISNGVARLFVTRNSAGQVVAAVAFLVSGQSAYYWLAGSEPGPAMTVLLSDALPTLYTDGIRAFDFVGANTPSIAEFKRRFGSVLQDYRGYYRVQSAVLRLANSARAAVNQLRRG
jgi:hypothetical protein